MYRVYAVLSSIVLLLLQFQLQMILHQDIHEDDASIHRYGYSATTIDGESIVLFQSAYRVNRKYCVQDQVIEIFDGNNNDVHGDNDSTITMIMQLVALFHGKYKMICPFHLIYDTRNDNGGNDTLNMNVLVGLFQIKYKRIRPTTTFDTYNMIQHFHLMYCKDNDDVQLVLDVQEVDNTTNIMQLVIVLYEVTYDNHKNDDNTVLYQDVNDNRYGYSTTTVRRPLSNTVPLIILLFQLSLISILTTVQRPLSSTVPFDDDSIAFM